MALGIGIGLALTLLGKVLIPDDGSPYVLTGYVVDDYFTP